MNVKEWLNRAYKIDQQMRSKREQIEQWELLAVRITGDPAAVHSGGAGHANRIEAYGIKIADACAEIEKQLEELINIKRETGVFIQRIGNTTSRVLLEQRYLVCKNWGDIAEFMGYTEEYTKLDLHRTALKEAREIF
jgi:hypothetical protein